VVQGVDPDFKPQYHTHTKIIIIMEGKGSRLHVKLEDEDQLETRSVAQAVERLFCKREVLSSNFSPTKKKKKKREREREPAAVAQPVILTTQEAEIRRIAFRSQPQANNSRDPIKKKTMFSPPTKKKKGW
jgi:hypothetical protein